MILKLQFLIVSIVVAIYIINPTVFQNTGIVANAQSIEATQASQPQDPTVLEQKFEAIITKDLGDIKADVYGQTQYIKQFEGQILNGPKKSETVNIQNGQTQDLSSRQFKVGDQVIISPDYETSKTNKYIITDSIRRTPLYILFVIFIGITILIGRKSGISSIAGMLLSFATIFIFLLPQIASGRNPIIVSLVSSLLIIPSTFYLSHGFNRKTTAAVVSTILCLIFTALLASIFVDAAKITGFASEEAGFIEAARPGAVNIKGLLLAGIIISLLGILDDITISQSSIVSQLKKTSPTLTKSALYSKAMEIGKDHIASVVNTLILVYAGAALPLLILFTDNSTPFLEIINYEIVAEEIVKTLVASIGMIAAVPIATLFSIYFLNDKDFTETNEHHHNH
ncbi:MAG: YibE/F family protein [bacterium]|nr:YibE/F family protein [bacterium]